MNARACRLAVDAADLARDRRGLGRAARAVIARAAIDERFALTLLADRPRDAAALRAEFPAIAIERTASAKRRGRYDLAWYPFNAMRFVPASPSVVTIADAFAFTQPHPEAIARAREQRPIARAARTASRIVTFSRWSRDEIVRALAIPRDRIEVVPLTPDPFWFPAADDGLPEGIAGTRFVLIAGVREARKNARLAIEACARALAGDEQLVIAGTPRNEDLALARRLRLRAGIVRPSDATLRALYRNAAVVLVPSIAEGFGLVAVEALACAAPVIVSDRSALPEATGGVALALDPWDAQRWATAIRRVLDDEDYARELRERAAAAFASADRSVAATRMLDVFLATASSTSRANVALNGAGP